MSRASKQSLTILAVVTGAIITVEEEGLSGKFSSAVYWARDRASKAVELWPETGNPRKNTKSMIDHVQNLHDELQKSKALYTALCLVTLSQILLTDLCEKLKDESKLSALRDLEEAVNGLSDLFDPEGTNFTLYVEAERLAQMVYDEIGFSRD